ncbi:hypothetical protein JCM21738_4127 [Mesobacillus boroniphilus JCM 21738]|uniref:Polymerase beta nucleotidyltransferase domain-containing protein n=1 Tax=Mesobacillus boroniphilus JCM 21738 TaxID=1294265 RepID=W4RU42_9BACI|nr:hypothetical protein JCM21738_4127 [Mesobacillus boroniphilus JCM 21738]
MEENLNSKVIDYLIEKIAPFWIVLFGSTANGNDRKDSDIDIAFLSDTAFDNYDLFMLARSWQIN